MKQKVLITGASGFLGFHLINAAIEANLEVYAAVRAKSNLNHLQGLPIQFIQLNYENELDLIENFKKEKYNYIIHAAGITKANSQAAYNLVNTIYSTNLAAAATHIGASLKRFVFISSLAAIGPLNAIDGSIDEEKVPEPVTAYGKSKLHAERNIIDLGLPITILRPTAIYGPREKDLFIVLNNLNKGLDPHIGKFDQKLSFVHGRDIADLAIQILNLPSADGAYNITDGHVYSRYDFVNIVKNVLQKKAVRVHLPLGLLKVIFKGVDTVSKTMNIVVPVSREKLNELAATNWACDITKATTALNFKPKFNLKTGLEETIAWYKANKWL